MSNSSVAAEIEKLRNEYPDLYKKVSRYIGWIMEVNKIRGGQKSRERLLEHSIPSELTVCAHSHIGKRPYMEDRMANFVGNKNIYMFAVFDGHGSYKTASLLRQHFLPFLFNRIKHSIGKKEMNSEITKAYLAFDKKLYELQQQTGKITDGSTAAVVIVAKPELYLINLGDSRTIVFNNNGKLIKATKDHKPDDHYENKRIREAGGNVIFEGSSNKGDIYRVNGILALSRAFGDLSLKKNKLGHYSAGEDALISSIPTITATKIDKNTNVLIASDGLWDLFYKKSEEESNKHAIKQINELIKEDKKDTICTKLINWSQKHGISDNISIIHIKLI